ncbi:DapH/DapD/GlmU-related protein [Desulfoscipio sp. XC116]|uniref:DapH/DapD/GlmU-related protein n=1 Tax=Desulfoscipio sp. XC116 TaxID=3144975 RepID=UPI00325B46CA
MSISEQAYIADNVIIGDNVIIEDGVYIDYNVIIRDNVHIKRNTYIGARCILGEYLADFYRDSKNKYHPLIVGEDSIIRSETILYGDSVIGDHFQTGHRVTIREKAIIGNNVRIGTLSDIQGHCIIEDYVNLHSNVHIGMKSVIKKYAWIFPYVVLTNDPNPPSEQLLGVTVNEYAVIATGSIILPGVDIGKDSLIAAGAIVTKDVPGMKVYGGNPAKEMCDITKIKNRTTGEAVYPWRYTFDRGMPWHGIGYDKWVAKDK